MSRGGGGDSSWHKSGSGSYKQNSIHDFISCANFLVNEDYVHRRRLGAIGYSAGGLLLGAAINMYPNLFCAAILKVNLYLEIKQLHLLFSFCELLMFACTTRFHFLIYATLCWMIICLLQCWIMKNLVILRYSLNSRIF